MAEVKSRRFRDKYPNPPHQISVPGINQYQRMADAPDFVMTTDGSLFRLDRFHGKNVKRLDYWA